MSKYKRADQKFREQIAALADAGLKFPTARAKLPVRKTSFGFNLPGFVAGLVWWSPFAAIGIVLIHWLLGGAR